MLRIIIDPQQFNAPFNHRVSPFVLPMNEVDGTNHGDENHHTENELTAEEWGHYGPKMKYIQHGSRHLPPFFQLQLEKHVKIPYSTKEHSLWDQS